MFKLLCVCFTFFVLFRSIDGSLIDIDGLEDDIIDLSSYGTRLFGTPSNKTGDIVAKWDPSMKMNPEEMGEYLEGDILHPPPSTKSGLISTTRRWANRIVPYVIVGAFNAAQRQLILSAMADIQSTTCIRFVARTTQRDFLRITSDSTGCWSSVGRIGGSQQLNLQIPGCVTLKGTAIHEFLHALGLIHEHSRPERNSFVNIFLQNVEPGAIRNFEVVSAFIVSSFGVGYDYGSVMHYGTHAFSRNGQPTIVPRQPGAQIGQRVRISVNDARTIRLMYRC